jgi:hypothetical protein
MRDNDDSISSDRLSRGQFTAAQSLRDVDGYPEQPAPRLALEGLQYVRGFLA